MLAGIGKSLRLYEMGKKALLRKCENSVSPPYHVKAEWFDQGSGLTCV